MYHGREPQQIILQPSHVLDTHRHQAAITLVSISFLQQINQSCLSTFEQSSVKLFKQTFTALFCHHLFMRSGSNGASPGNLSLLLLIIRSGTGDF